MRRIRMKKSLIILLLFFTSGKIMSTPIHPLPSAPQTIEQFHEIATQYSTALPQAFNSLSAQERIFIYYIFRAGLPGNNLIADQIHRYGVQIIKLFEYINSNEDRLRAIDQETKLFDGHVDEILAQVKTYLVYLWTNHGQYFLKEHAQQKRTPSRIGLTQLTQHIIEKIVTFLGGDVTQVKLLAPFIFDDAVEPTLCIENSIEQSAVNFYAPEFTEALYQTLSAQERTYINAYYGVDKNAEKPVIEHYKIGGRYSKELDVAYYWLEKAYEHAKMHPDFFDEHLITSLDLLLKFIQTGDEQYFRDHSVAWTKSNSRVDYLFGFIETYDDPKGYRGTFESEVTIKSIDMKRLNSLLPLLEKQLPVPDEYKRKNLEDLAAIPNASINVMAFGAGQSGPLSIVAAYCLPNYPELRAQYGSKQVMYQAEKSLASLLNPVRAVKLDYHPKRAEWLLKNDPNGVLGADIWTVHCILHETLGHGSGRLATHVVEQDSLFIDDILYKKGQEVPVTSENINEFLGAGHSALEELRAEIIALYTSIYMFDELAQAGLYKNWPTTIGKEAFIEWLIIDMLHTGLRRLRILPEGSTEIAGAHAQANVTIMHYLLDHGGVELSEQRVTLDDTEYTVLDFDIVDKQKTLAAITKLMTEVQEIKSTANRKQLDHLFNTYGRKVRNRDYVTQLKRNQQAVVGDLKVSARLFPLYQPVKDANGTVIDITASWPATIFEQQRMQRALMLSKE